jgi:hypothetical protein
MESQSLSKESMISSFEFSGTLAEKYLLGNFLHRMVEGWNFWSRAV